jgi:hypothetical protein
VQYPEGIMPKAMDIALIYIDRTGRNA